MHLQPWLYVLSRNHGVVRIDSSGVRHRVYVLAHVMRF